MKRSSASVMRLGLHRSAPETRHQSGAHFLAGCQMKALIALAMASLALSRAWEYVAENGSMLWHDYRRCDVEIAEFLSCGTTSKQP
jgi:hypothetical protein